MPASSPTSAPAALALGLAALLFLFFAGCAEVPPHDPEQLAGRQRLARLEAEAQRSVFSAKLLLRLLAKTDSVPAGVTPPPVDILILSGGGEYGAFGVGVLQGWRPDGPLPRPEFDVVTGVSTGAMIAPFALLGTTASIERVDKLYRRTDRNLAVLRDIFFFLPWRESFYDNSALRERVRTEMDEALAGRIAEAYAAGRLLLIGTTDLDLGRMRVWDFGREAERAVAAGSLDRLADILLASAAIPAVFPPVAIDGVLHVDGGATQQAFAGFDLEQLRAAVAEARRLRPAARLPAVRMWVIVNGPLDDAIESIAPHWDAVAKRSLRVFMSYSQRVTLRHLEFGAALLSAETGTPFEFRYVAVPDEFPRRPRDASLFDQDFMLRLGDLGRRTGAAPNSWRTTVGPVEQLDAESTAAR